MSSTLDGLVEQLVESVFFQVAGDLVGAGQVRAPGLGADLGELPFAASDLGVAGEVGDDVGGLRFVVWVVHEGVAVNDPTLERLIDGQEVRRELLAFGTHDGSVLG